MVKRKRLMLLCGLAGLGVILLAAALLLWMRRPAETYKPGENIEGITRSLARAIPKDHPEVVFGNASEAAGIDFRHFHGRRSTQLPEDMGSGAAWGDYDNDGHEDLFLVNIAGPLTLSPAELAQSPATNRLYHNNGDGTFTDVTKASGLGEPMVGMGAAWGDADGDGDLDLVLTAYQQLKLYRNEGDGRFSDMTTGAGLGDARGFWAGAAWGDYDRDGDLDLYVCGYVQYAYRPEDAGRAARQYQAVVPYTLNPSSYPPERNLLFRNEGGGRFTEVAEPAGVQNVEGRSLSAAWCDFDEDGWLDLYVANDVSDNALFHNQGDGTFADASHEAWVADYRGAMGIAVGDWDGDGDQDLFITHWIAQENALYSNLKHAFGNTEQASEALHFMDIADMAGLGQIALDYIGWATFFFDYDNDGRPDLFVANGSTFQDENDPSRLVAFPSLLFWNGGGERGFFEVSGVSGEVFKEPRVSRGAAFADYDEDGDLDLVIVNHGGKALLLRNEGGHRNHWLRVAARSKRGNRFGLGAKVYIEAGGASQYAQIGSQSSYLSQNPYAAHFGLGRAEKVERVLVVFPSGKRVEQDDVAADQRLTIWEEGS